MSDSKVQIIRNTINFIEEHLYERIELEKVSDEVNYSKYYLHRLFRETVGLTIHEYVQRRKLT